jgi:hypothetical protein
VISCRNVNGTKKIICFDVRNFFFIDEEFPSMRIINFRKTAN